MLKLTLRLNCARLFVYNLPCDRQTPPPVILYGLISLVIPFKVYNYIFGYEINQEVSKDYCYVDSLAKQNTPFYL